MNMSDINLNDMKPRAGRNPFMVPDGYFDHFADEFVAKLSEQPQVARPHTTWWRRDRYWGATAACVCGLVGGTVAFLHRAEPAAQVVVTHASTTADTFDQMTDYAMYDKGDMYASLYDY